MTRKKSETRVEEVFLEAGAYGVLGETRLGSIWLCRKEVERMFGKARRYSLRLSSEPFEGSRVCEIESSYTGDWKVLVGGEEMELASQTGYALLKRFGDVVHFRLEGVE